MIVTTRTFQPALGKEAELRALLTEWVRTRQSGGADSTLVRRIFNSEPITFVISSRFADLAAVDEGRKQVVGSDAFARFQERQQGLLAASPSHRLYAVRLQPRRAGQSAPSALPAGGIVATWQWTPALGRGAEAQRVLKEYTEILQEQGHRIGLRERMLSDEGPQLVGTLLHDNVAEHQAFRETVLPTEEMRTFMQRINPLLGAPTINRFYEVLVPFPGR